MFENSHTAEEKLQELLQQYGVTKTEECSDGLHFGYGTPYKCIFCFHRESEDGTMPHENENDNKNIRVEVFPYYDILRKNKKFFEHMKKDCLENSCYERLGKLVDWYENGTEKNHPHPADMYYSDSIDVVDDKGIWYLEDDNVKKVKYDFKAFDRVVTRIDSDSVWTANIFSHIDERGEYVTIGYESGYTYCLPFNEETAKLIGTTNDYNKD